MIVYLLVVHVVPDDCADLLSLIIGFIPSPILSSGGHNSNINYLHYIRESQVPQ